MTDWESIVLLTHAGATTMLAGLIWFVQVVHYPLMAGVGVDSYPAWQREHHRRTGSVAGPLMVIELAAAVWLVAQPNPRVDAQLAWAGLGLLSIIWVSTFGLQVPQHRMLRAGFDATVQRRLVRGNWIRTAVWTIRAGLALWLLARFNLAAAEG